MRYLAWFGPHRGLSEAQIHRREASCRSFGSSPRPFSSSSPCSRSVGGSNGGGRAGNPRHSSMAAMAFGSVTVATILIRPLQRGLREDALEQFGPRETSAR